MHCAITTANKFSGQEASLSELLQFTWHLQEGNLLIRPFIFPILLSDGIFVRISALAVWVNSVCVSNDVLSNLLCLGGPSLQSLSRGQGALRWRWL